MSSLPPLTFFAATAGGLLFEMPPGRVLAGGGTGGGALARCVALGGPPDCRTVGGAACTGGWLAGPWPPMFGSDPRPGGGGGLLGDGAGDDWLAARIVPLGGMGGGRDGGAGSLPGSVGCVGAGFGIPSNVFFIAMSLAVRGAATCWPEPGGGGGAAAGFRSEFFFPRPSKISRSDPPLLSSDIRVS
jgi:hypothetical protein